MNADDTRWQLPGQDSFLDVIANLVGILIILITVVGMQARAAYVHVTADCGEERWTTERQELQALRQTADGIEMDVHSLTGQLQRLAFEVAYREKEREKAVHLVTLLQQTLDHTKSQLHEADRQRLEDRVAIAQLEKELVRLEQERRGVEAAESRPSVLEHLPTPMAKTVFGQELHVRLMGGRVTVLPWEQIIETLKQHAQQQVWKLREVPSLTDETGPVGGFRIRYTLHVVDYSIETKVGPVVQKRVELDRFELVPTHDDLGEPLEQALAPNSQFAAHLGLHDARTTTVTVWVYPDSFDEFRRLRAFLYQQGFLTAARPLPANHLIGGSPYGSRSEAQ